VPAIGHDLEPRYRYIYILNSNCAVFFVCGWEMCFVASMGENELQVLKHEVKVKVKIKLSLCFN
jgi:hypothetical protein